MITKKMKALVEGGSAIRAMFEEGKKMAAIYGSENIFNFTIGNPSVEPPAAVNEAMKEILDTEKPLALHTEQGIIMTSGAAAAIVVIANS